MMQSTPAGLDPLDLKQLAARARLLAQPIDFEQLESEGLLRKTGAWYHAPRPDKLPEHVTAKIRSMQTRSGKLFFKFMGTTGAQKLLKQLERLGF